MEEKKLDSLELIRREVRRIEQVFRARYQIIKRGEEKALTHTSVVADREPSWGSVDKTKLPRGAYAERGEAGKKSSWGFPHHFVVGGSVGDDGIYTTGTMYLHKGGLNAAWAAAQGARSGQEASSAVKAHLQRHRSALGLKDIEPDESKPYENEFSCRLADPSNFDRFRRKNGAVKHQGKRIDFIFGIKNNKAVLQAMRYPKSIWKASEVKNHCTDHKGKFDV